MKFLVSEIRDAGPVTREASYEPAILGTLPDMVTVTEPVTARIKGMMTHEGEIVFTGNIAATFNFQCGRCLERFDQPEKLEFMHVVTPEGLEVDLSSEIRETVLLDLPVSAVCRESCKGVCTHCGTNLNKGTCNCTATGADVRWDALKQLRFK